MKILFIGDCRPANNYGSIATTESMLRLVQGIMKDTDELKIIDRRSFDKATPPDGHDSEKSITDMLKGILKEIFPQSMIDVLIKLKSCGLSYDKESHKYYSHLHIPYRYSLFEQYYQEMIAGKRLQYEMKLLKWADIVIIQGEGAVIRGTEKHGVYNIGGRYVIFMAWLAKVKFKKPTSLVNHTVDPDNGDAWEMIENTYPCLDHILVREPISKTKLAQHDVMNVDYAPDALFSYVPNENWIPSEYLKKNIDFSKPYICIGCSTALNTNIYQTSVKWDIVGVYTQLIKGLKKLIPQVVFVDGFRGRNVAVNAIIRKNNLPYVNLHNCPYQDLYHVFEHSSLFISGRWHSSILALLSNTPILLYGADSHKTRALYDVIDYKYPFFETKTLPLHVDDILKSAKEILGDVNIRSQIKDIVDKCRVLSLRNIEFLKARGGGVKRLLKLLYLAALITFRMKKKKVGKINELSWFGAYGNTNVGDDLIFFSLRKYIPEEVKIHLSCRQHIPTTDYETETFYKGDRQKCKQVISHSDAVWVGGGGLFEYYANTYPESWIVSYLLPLAYAIHYGKRYAIVGIGCNEKAIPNPMLRYIFRKICNKAEFIITRDEKSKKGFENNGVTIPNLIASLDPVLNYRQSISKIGSNIKTIGILAWPFYMWPYFHSSDSLETIYSQMSDAKTKRHIRFINELKKLKAMIESQGLNVRFPVFHFSDMILLKEMGVESSVMEYKMPTIEGYFNEIEQCDIVISMRYHGQITNYLQGNIVISVPVQEKMFALNEIFKMKDLEVPIDNFTCKEIMTLISKIQRNPDSYRKRLMNTLYEKQSLIQQIYEEKLSSFFQ